MSLKQIVEERINERKRETELNEKLLNEKVEMVTTEFINFITSVLQNNQKYKIVTNDLIDNVRMNTLIDITIPKNKSVICTIDYFILINYYREIVSEMVLNKITDFIQENELENYLLVEQKHTKIDYRGNDVNAYGLQLKVSYIL